MVGNIRTRGYLTSTVACWQDPKLRLFPSRYRDEDPIEVAQLLSIPGRRF
jgi:hypothetical protein